MSEEETRNNEANNWTIETTMQLSGNKTFKYCCLRCLEKSNEMQLGQSLVPDLSIASHISDLFSDSNVVVQNKLDKHLTYQSFVVGIKSEDFFFLHSGAS